MIRFTLAGVLVGVMLGSAAPRAHENYRIIGTVTKVTATELAVKQTKDGKTITMDFTEQTRVTRDKKTVTRAEIKNGASVVVDAHGDSLEFLEVVAVRIVPAPAKK